MTVDYDVLVIGGGVNGVAIARDAVGRGYSVALAEMNDLAWATSSASTKLFHGGLRYLEYFEFGLVRKALIEREALLEAMPHISWPMRFVLPYHSDMRFDSDTPTSRVLNRIFPWLKGRRPAALLRLGLFLYDNMGGRKILPATTSVDLTTDPAGDPLKAKFEKAYEYSDCWIEDSRLVSLSAKDAKARGADIWTRTKVVSASRQSDHWIVTLRDMLTGAERSVTCTALVNAAGPWVADITDDTAKIDTKKGVRLVRGSHIVTNRLFDHDKCYFFQGRDGRISFAIPYETDFTLLGTTDAAHEDADTSPECSDTERDYMLNFASEYFEKPVTQDDIVWSYSGVRPLYDDGASSATAATREYVLDLDQTAAPILSVYGGKITTHRKLAEAVVDQLNEAFGKSDKTWTKGVALPGGDFAVEGVQAKIDQVMVDYSFLTTVWARRMIKAYGTEAWDILGDAQAKEDLGQEFGATLTAREVDWLIAQEFAVTAEDIIWRRTKLGLRLNSSEVDALNAYLETIEIPRAA